MNGRKALLLIAGLIAVAGMWLLPRWAVTRPLPGSRQKLSAKLNAQGQRSQPTPTKPDPPEEEDEELPRLGLPIKSGPDSIVSFSLPPLNVGGSYISRVRLAVLEGGDLHIFRPGKDGKLISDFFLEPPKFEQWNSLEISGPSGSEYALKPGIMIRGEYSPLADQGGDLSLAVFYLDGKFRVVFKGGDAHFMYISWSALPEIIESTEYRHDIATGGYFATRVRVWTWDGQRYRPVADIAPDDIFSPVLRRAIEKIVPKNKTTKPPDPKPHKPMN